jgi:hypothetical protein
MEDLHAVLKESGLFGSGGVVGIWIYLVNMSDWNMVNGSTGHISEPGTLPG